MSSGRYTSRGANSTLKRALLYALLAAGIALFLAASSRSLDTTGSRLDGIEAGVSSDAVAAGDRVASESDLGTFEHEFGREDETSTLQQAGQATQEASAGEGGAVQEGVQEGIQEAEHRASPDTATTSTAESGAFSPVYAAAEVTDVSISAAGVPAADISAAGVPEASVPAADVPAEDVPAEDVPAGSITHAEQLLNFEDNAGKLMRRVPKCADALPKPGGFIMIMSSHTGSTAMMSQLVQHPSIKFDLPTMEPLNTFDFEEEDPWSAADWADDFFKRNGNDLSGRISGFKMSSVTVIKAPERFKKLVKDYNLRILWNYRLNIFKKAIGRYPYYYLNDNSTVGGINASQEDDRCSMGVGCNYTVKDAKDLHCVMVRTKRVDDYMEKAVKILTEDHGCYLELPYEDYVRYPSDQMNQIYDFLGIERQLLDAKRGKATSDNMCEVIDNFAEMCAAFNGCSAWSWMLNDEENGCSCDKYSYESLGSDETNTFCQTARPEGYLRWCGGFNYEEDVERIKELQAKGAEAMSDFKKQKLGSTDAQVREPTIITN